MNPRTAGEWLEAYAYAQANPKLPRILAKEAAKHYPAALRATVDEKPAKKAARRLGARVKLTPLPKLKKELDRVFSIWARTRDMDENGIATCVTCGRQDHWKNMDAGHYVPRQDMSTRWHEFNVWPQCRPDNAFRGGEPEKMAAYIDKTVGPAIAAFLRDLAKRPFKPTRQWYENQIRIYKARIPDGAVVGGGASPEPSKLCPLHGSYPPCPWCEKGAPDFNEPPAAPGPDPERTL